VRLTTGLVLFLYVLMHFLNHSFGIRSVEAMQAASDYLLAPWQTGPGLALLYGALLTHMTLGLYALYRRRHLRMPSAEVFQLVLGLAVPLLLISHAAAVRIAEARYDLQIGYVRVVYQYWLVSPDFALPRQLLLMLVVWVHGCIGIRAWLRSKTWYAARVPQLAALATVIPVLAVLGFVNAGLDMRDVAAANPASLPAHVRDMPGTPQAEAMASVYRAVDMLTLSYIAIVAGVFALRIGRDWHANRFRAVRITYPGGRVVSVPNGFTILEASRWGGIPHASVCGGRGRCSTCRVDIVAGGEDLPPPGAEERRLLDRIGAPASVRLACQTRPERDMAVVPLIHPVSRASDQAGALGMPTIGRREANVAALFVDLRQSTRLADDRLPYDTLFIVERYIGAVSAAVRASGGHITNIAGDGIMSVFGVNGSAGSAVLDATLAAIHLWDGIDALNQELHEELSDPLRFGIGLHVGVAVVGAGWDGGLEGMPFLGDTGNVAARLESEAKRTGTTMVMSRDVLQLLANGSAAHNRASISLPGKQEPMEVTYFQSADELRLVMNKKAA